MAKGYMTEQERIQKRLEKKATDLYRVAREEKRKAGAVIKKLTIRRKDLTSWDAFIANCVRCSMSYDDAIIKLIKKDLSGDFDKPRKKVEAILIKNNK